MSPVADYAERLQDGAQDASRWSESALVTEDGSSPSRWARTRRGAQFRLVTKILLRLSDATAIGLALALAYVFRFVVPENALVDAGRYAMLAGAFGVAWLVSLVLAGTYEYRFLGVGTEEYRRVATATLWLFGALAIAFYVAKADVARGFVAVALPVGLAALLTGRALVRRYLRARRADGAIDHRVLLIGESESLDSLERVLLSDPGAGFTVVGVCSPFAGGESATVSCLDDVADHVRRVDADVVAVAASERLTPNELKRIAWALECVDVDLIVAPSLTDVAGPRVHVRPVGGVPLMYVDQPALSGPARLAKTVVDRVGAGLGLLFLGIPLLLVAGLIRVTSPGPALFRQKRSGLDGQSFEVLKFRTMYVDAEQRKAELAEQNHGGGQLYKVAGDPRVTPVGRFLRRTSIDELPQLINVLKGEMSLVGPRPLVVETDRYREHELRRHLVLPGITGLWQVNGREDQDWDELVRLDLHYVENWSFSLDFAILARTLGVALRGS
jgi:exopolysaccharide biosynthesis polyprenyl glycosylphosphotransferase